MNRMRQTSLEAFSAIEGRLSASQEAVWALFRHGDMLCDKQIATLLGWPINCVTPRRGELVDLGLLEAAGKIKYFGRNSIVWRRAMRLFAGREVTG